MELDQINKFMSCKKLAVAGVSRNKNKTGTAIYNELKKQNRNVVPINPNIDTFENEKCYSDIQELPSDIDALIIATNSEISPNLIQEAIHKGIKNIFLQLGSIKKGFKFEQIENINIISNRCIFMFINPKGIHKCHEVFAKLIKTYPN